MKKLFALAVLVAATVAVLCVPEARAQVRRGSKVWLGTVDTPLSVGGSLYVNNFGPVTRIIPFTTAAIDFASATITCRDSAGTTVTGARTTDTCVVGMPSSLTAGGTGLHDTYSCYVSAADTIKIRACAAGTADDPGSVTFTGYVISQTAN
jgi:hypothetical protein